MQNKIVIVAGSGRSGTTWVQDALAEANGLRTVFEPLHPTGVPESRKFSYQYIEPEADHPDLKLFMNKALYGNYRSIWMNYRIRPDRFNLYRVGIKQAAYNATKLARHYRKYRKNKNNGIIVKFIRANLMLPWLVRQYGLPVLFITRHPCAVISSRLKLGGNDWASQRNLERYRSIPAVVELIKCEFGIDIKQSFSIVEALACVWCIENILPLQWAHDGGYVVTAYEILINQPDKEWNRIVHELALQNAPHKMLRESPSQQASMQMHGMKYTRGYIGKWRDELSVDQIRGISAMLERFRFSGYSVENDFPSQGL